MPGATHRGQVKEAVRFCRVQKVQELHLKQDRGIGRDQGGAADCPKGIIWLEEESCQLTFLHGEQPNLQAPKSDIWKGQDTMSIVVCALNLHFVQFTSLWALVAAAGGPRREEKKTQASELRQSKGPSPPQRTPPTAQSLSRPTWEAAPCARTMFLPQWAP